MVHAVHSLFLVAEVIVIVLYAFCTTYSDGAINTGRNATEFVAQDLVIASDMARLYPFFQDVHVLVFVGFGFQMVFMKTNSWTSVVFTYIISCWCIQLNILTQNAW